MSFTLVQTWTIAVLVFENLKQFSTVLNFYGEKAVIVVQQTSKLDNIVFNILLALNVIPESFIASARLFILKRNNVTDKIFFEERPFSIQNYLKL